MYKNLEAEITRHGISKKDIAELIGKTYETFTLKLNGKYPFTLNEAVRIKRSLFPEYSIEYLFDRDEVDEETA